MKLFIYKSLVIFLILFLGFHLTFRSAQRSIERKIDNLTSKENIDVFKDNIRKQIKEIIEKDQIINKEDALLIRKLLEKVQKEIYEQN